MTKFVSLPVISSCLNSRNNDIILILTSHSLPSGRDEDAPAKISDEDAVKPDGWLDDEPEYIGDPSAVKPEDW